MSDRAGRALQAFGKIFTDIDGINQHRQEREELRALREVEQQRQNTLLDFGKRRMDLAEAQFEFNKQMALRKGGGGGRQPSLLQRAQEAFINQQTAQNAASPVDPITGNQLPGVSPDQARGAALAELGGRIFDKQFNIPSPKKTDTTGSFVNTLFKGVENDTISENLGQVAGQILLQNIFSQNPESSPEALLSVYSTPEKVRDGLDDNELTPNQAVELLRRLGGR